MKSVFLSAIFTLLVFCLAGQNCEGFYYFTANAEVIMTMYDKKTEENGKMVYKISNIVKNDNTTTAAYTSEVTDQKGKTLSKGAGQYKCTGGAMFVDARVALPQDNMTAYKDMEVKAGEIFIEYPAGMNTGQSLSDVNFAMSVWNNGAKFSEITLKQTGRKVESKETITSTAGAWECWKISYEGQFRAAVGPIGIPFNYKGIEWFAPGFGIVKTETYTKNGKLAGSTLITSIKK